MRRVIKLLDVESVIFKFDNSSFIIIDVAIIRSWKNRYHQRESLGPTPFVHLVSVNLRLVRSYDGQQVVVFQKIIHSICTFSFILIPIKIRTASYFIVPVTTFTIAIWVVNWISPKHITKQPLPRGLLDSIDSFYVFQGFEFRGYSSVKC